METQTFTRFLRSFEAMQAHLLFGGGIIIFSVALLTGENPEGGKLALGLFVIGYPLTLGLLWLQHKEEIKTAIRDAKEREEQPLEFRRKRKIYRMIALLFLFAVSVGLVIAGFGGWLLSGIPAHFVGYGMLVFAAAGVAGLNIWIGGPLDMRDDPPITTIDDDVT
jgi:hypothetical protein